MNEFKDKIHVLTTFSHKKRFILTSDFYLNMTYNAWRHDE